ncbi:hypothetical protein ACFQZZ_03590 [Nocardia sp. GCM10030253]|uniref:hypothetical protein n=1 Tax=Nocardia sp. GCM10030253 TaxID=3273404 RepID=UPI0036259CF2
MSASEAEIRTVWRLPASDTLRGRRALWWSVGPEGELAILLVHRRHLNHSEYVKGWVGWWPTAIPFAGELVVIRGREEQRISVPDIGVRPSHLALLPDSRFLLAGGRTRRTEAQDSWEPNAVVLSGSGAPEDQFCIGDDIPTLVTDRSGGIWTAYGDEGIYGGHPESGAGLAGWDTEGRAIWTPQRRLPDVPLDGCTAATEGEQVWLAWYAGPLRGGDLSPGPPRGGTFLTRITPSTGDVSSYRSPVSQPDGFAIRDNRAVLTVRDHNERSTELIRAELHDTTWTVTSRHKLRVPGRVVMHCGQGRDGSLYLRADDTWLTTQA